jgi:hypothetical protein
VDITLEPGPGVEIQVERGDIDKRGRREWVLTATLVDSGLSTHLATTRAGVTVGTEVVIDERGEGLLWLVDGVEVVAVFPPEG